MKTKTIIADRYMTLQSVKPNKDCNVCLSSSVKASSISVGVVFPLRSVFLKVILFKLGCVT